MKEPTDLYQPSSLAISRRPEGIPSTQGRRWLTAPDVDVDRERRCHKSTDAPTASRTFNRESRSDRLLHHM